MAPGDRLAIRSIRKSKFPVRSAAIGQTDLNGIVAPIHGLPERGAVILVAHINIEYQSRRGPAQPDFRGEVLFTAPARRSRIERQFGQDRLRI